MLGAAHLSTSARPAARPPARRAPPRPPRQKKRGLRNETEAMSIYAASAIRAARGRRAARPCPGGGEETICNCFHMNGNGNEVAPRPRTLRGRARSAAAHAPRLRTVFP